MGSKCHPGAERHADMYLGSHGQEGLTGQARWWKADPRLLGSGLQCSLAIGKGGCPNLENIVYSRLTQGGKKGSETWGALAASVWRLFLESVEAPIAAGVMPTELFGVMLCPLFLVRQRVWFQTKQNQWKNKSLEFLLFVSIKKLWPPRMWLFFLGGISLKKHTGQSVHVTGHRCGELKRWGGPLRRARDRGPMGGD